jgi:uncharacterized protein (TIGR03437 family)
MMRFAYLLLILSAATVWRADAQTWDTSGNSMLKGTYYFREVAYVVGDDYGDLSEAAAVYNTISFDGNGNYTVNAIVADSGANSLETLNTSGKYSIAASGYGFIQNPLITGAYIYGLVSQQGIFIGSSTESGYNDLFVAAPVSSPAATNASLKGSYTIADMDVTLALEQGDIGYALGSTFTINPDGAGNLGSFVVSGYLGGAGSSLYTQTNTAIKYAFSNGAASFTIPSSNAATLMVGQEYIYISPDGNFIFGGSPDSWDFFVGVRTGTGTPNFNGLYYQAGVDENEANYSTDGYGELDTYFGSLQGISGTIIGHQRLSDPFVSSVGYGYTYSDSYSVPSNGAYTDTNTQTKFVVGANGAVRIGSGIGPYLGLTVALAAPQLSPSGVWIDPQGIENAGSFAPFTAGVVPGELITIFGNNLASGTAVASSIPFPQTLGNVQVNINGLPAPIYYVTSSQIAVIVPYATASASIANISVVNNGTTSNTVSEFVYTSSPGLLTQGANGLGDGAILHAADYSLVTPQHPAVAGETVAVYLTGLGPVSPAIPDGAAGPSSPPSNTTNTVTADLNGTAATVSFAGLAPTLAGLYQINLTIPTGLTSGENYLDVQVSDGSSCSSTTQCALDSATSEATIAVGTGSATTSVETEAVKATPAGHGRPSSDRKPVLKRTAPPCLRPVNGACR